MKNVVNRETAFGSLEGAEMCMDMTAWMFALRYHQR